MMSRIKKKKKCFIIILLYKKKKSDRVPEKVKIITNITQKNKKTIIISPQLSLPSSSSSSSCPGSVVRLKHLRVVRIIESLPHSERPVLYKQGSVGEGNNNTGDEGATPKHTWEEEYKGRAGCEAVCEGVKVWAVGSGRVWVVL